ncbi:MAG: Flp pilus assembly protein CpaB [Phycisphaeraceae bacterium]
MNAKWILVSLILLGAVAAFCAAMLSSAFQPRPAEVTTPDRVPMLVATRALPSMGIVEAGAVKQIDVPFHEAPAGALSNPVQVVGRVLVVPVIEGQPFTNSNFAVHGPGMELAAVLPRGMRAVAVPLTEHSALQGLLYPGSLVDVLASFRLRTTSNSSDGQAVSTTLLQSVEVLAIEDRTILSPRDEREDTGSAHTARRQRMVTLMVDSEQAKALQLALEHGTVTLAMRNPLDGEAVARDATVLSGGRLAQLATMLDPNALGQRAINNHEALLGQQISLASLEPTSIDADEAGPADDRAVEAPPVATRSARWDTRIIRGVTIETRSFDLPDEESMEDKPR